MPIYEYRCSACGVAKEHLQKLSDAPVANCPACGSADYRKQLSAAGFQLKGSGWYATDFKGGASAASSSDGGGGHSCGTGCGCD
ncbi:FmdB family zinc ribbon protein [Chromobacterium sphagni]|uniref:FmdB family transcriptional regulator n=1 Tax=Chromobacterium sphagni TaxID=1903179 RepID=A0A1S1X088_9NEIS|nr:zinc ribbon domain-containing protein [Chromobacterium sphagni]OHX12934.1 FmdB family transcriptional regulator [Chromobacterium sphagni]OHX19862.1 FmdB family transcriptional regulator [Chromobacterium sphagni]